MVFKMAVWGAWLSVGAGLLRHPPGIFALAVAYGESQSVWYRVSALMMAVVI